METLDPQVVIIKDETVEISNDLYRKILSEISVVLESNGMDSSAENGAEWIPKKLLKPKKKDDVIRNTEVK